MLICTILILSKLALGLYVTGNETANWYIIIHDKGHFLHINNGPEMYGLDYTYQAFDATALKEINQSQYFALQVALSDVTYIKDEYTLCNEEKQV